MREFVVQDYLAIYALNTKLSSYTDNGFNTIDIKFKNNIEFKPSHFIETGIAHGYSSYIILSALDNQMDDQEVLRRETSSLHYGDTASEEKGVFLAYIRLAASI